MSKESPSKKERGGQDTEHLEGAAEKKARETEGAKTGEEKEGKAENTPDTGPLKEAKQLRELLQELDRIRQKEKDAKDIVNSLWNERRKIKKEAEEMGPLNVGDEAFSFEEARKKLRQLKSDTWQLSSTQKRIADTQEKLDGLNALKRLFSEDGKELKRLQKQHKESLAGYQRQVEENEKRFPDFKARYLDAFGSVEKALDANGEADDDAREVSESLIKGFEHLKDALWEKRKPLEEVVLEYGNKMRESWEGPEYTRTASDEDVVEEALEQLLDEDDEKAA